MVNSLTRRQNNSDNSNYPDSLIKIISSLISLKYYYIRIISFIDVDYGKAPRITPSITSIMIYNETRVKNQNMRLIIFTIKRILLIIHSFVSKVGTIQCVIHDVKIKMIYIDNSFCVHIVSYLVYFVFVKFCLRDWLTFSNALYYNNLNEKDGRIELLTGLAILDIRSITIILNNMKEGKISNNSLFHCIEVLHMVTFSEKKYVTIRIWV
uniref:Uncharacterized protein n=1 Tax=Rhizophagus irregularis (strain DAOM 181602 / DAOM 197198 / MUCL 43194) TaxID=747089 RepID=U9TU60_RHIID